MNAGSHRGLMPKVAREMRGLESPVFFTDRIQHLRCPILAAIVHADHLERLLRRVEDRNDARVELVDDELLVEERHNKRNDRLIDISHYCLIWYHETIQSLFSNRFV